VTPSAACRRCGSVDELEQTRVLRPDAGLCDTCWCELDSGLSRRPRDQRRSGAATRAGRCADCGRQPSRGLPLGGVYDAAGARRMICFACYFKQCAPRRVEHHELEPLTSDQIFVRAADLVCRGRLDRARARELIRRAHAAGGVDRLDELRSRREQHQRELEASAPTLAELTAEQVLETFPGAELDPTDVDRAAEVIASALTGSKYVIGRWWPSAPIRRGLTAYEITDETVIDAALGVLKVQVQTQGANGARWRLERNPELPRPAIERTAACRCNQRTREWRPAVGGAWTCALCHPPVDGLEVQSRTAPEGQS
jgi:hypothetical protein